jgi:hypothetical protein
MAFERARNRSQASIAGLCLLLVFGVVAVAAEEVVDASQAHGGEPTIPGVEMAPLPPPRSYGCFTDSFDRPDSSDMGPNWTEFTGELIIEAMWARGDLDWGFSYMLHNSASIPHELAVMSLDLLPLPADGPPGAHVGLICGAEPQHMFWIYVKIQDNDGDGQYDRLFFYNHGNSMPWGVFTIEMYTPIDAAHVTIYFSDDGDTLFVELDSDFDGVVDQAYQTSGAVAAYANGTAFGVAAFARGIFDNWKVCGRDPSPPVPATSWRSALLLATLLAIAAAITLRWRAGRDRHRSGQAKP